MNSLIERDVIDALYAASQAGVKISMVIRGICGLRPGIKGLSETIRVKSVIGRFLEHSRIVCFGSGHGLPSDGRGCSCPRPTGWGATCCAGWKRWWKSDNPTVKAQIVRQIMAANLFDEAQSWVLDATGRYRRNVPEPGDAAVPFSCHRFFMENPSLSGRGSAGADDVPALGHAPD